MEILILLIFILMIFVPLIGSMVRIVNQYERGIVLTFGRFSGIKEPGLRFLIPGIQTMRKVDVRTTPIDVPKK